MRCTFRGIILEENLHDVDMLGTREGISTNTDAKSLTEANIGRLCDGLVGQSSRARDNTCVVRHRTRSSTVSRGKSECAMCLPILPGLWMWPG